MVVEDAWVGHWEVRVIISLVSVSGECIPDVSTWDKSSFKRGRERTCNIVQKASGTTNSAKDGDFCLRLCHMAKAVSLAIELSHLR